METSQGGVALRRQLTPQQVEVDIDDELAQLRPTGYRPLCVRHTLF